MNDKIKDAYTKALESGLVLTEQTAFTLGYIAHQKEAAEQKPVAVVAAHGMDDALSHLKLGTNLYIAPVNQSARIAELEAEAKYLHSEIDDCHKRLAATQAENAKLRALLSEASGWVDEDQLDGGRQLFAKIEQTLATPSDTSALESLLEAERTKVAEACAKVVDYHYDECEPWLDREMLLREWKGFVK